MAQAELSNDIAPAPDADRHVKRMTCDMDFDTLECPICTELLCPPVFQCNNGHTACARCCKKLTKKLCPSCSLPIGGSRCIAIEKIIESLQELCRHAVRGCNEKLHYTKINEHEELCEFRSFHCPLVGCRYEGHKVEITQHFQKNHGVVVYEMRPDVDNGKLPLSVTPDFPSCTEYVLVEDSNEGGTFLFHYRFDAKFLRYSFFCTSFGACNRFYRLKAVVNRRRTEHNFTIETPVCDNQLGKDWETQIERRGDFPK